VSAQLGAGTWVRTDVQGKGIVRVDSPMDGSEVPALVGGKPSGETMAIKRIDERHYSAVIERGGQPAGTSNGTVSPDGKSLTVETISQAGPGAPPKKVTETWVKK
jgi:hypothetical protein